MWCTDKEDPAAQRRNENGCGGESGSSHNVESRNSAIASTGYENLQVLDAYPFTPAEMAEAQNFKSSYQLKEPVAKIAALLRGVRKNSNDNASNGSGNGNGSYQQVNVNSELSAVAPTSFPRTPAKKQRINELKRQINKRAYRLSCLRRVEPSNIHTQWMSLGNNSNEQSTEAELIQKLDWIEQQISWVCKQTKSDK